MGVGSTLNQLANSFANYILLSIIKNLLLAASDTDMRPQKQLGHECLSALAYFNFKMKAGL
jgi:hypothetical protein